MRSSAVPVIYLVRHGQASYGADDYDVLSPLGEEQSAVVAAEFVRRGVESPVLVAGDLVRQRTTAQLMIDAADYAAEVAVDPRWNEYAHPDLPLPLTGVGDSYDFQKLLDGALETWIRADSPDGWRGFRENAVAALHELAAGLGSGETGIAVSSGGTLTAIVSSIWGMDTQGTVRLNRVFANASITAVVVGKQGLNLLSVNDHAHLHGREGLLTYR